MAEPEHYQHYEVLRKEDGSLWELGRGAMGITYKAFDTNLRCAVALKVINNAYLNSDVARQRFLREARAAAALRHQNVASVFHLGSDNDCYFYAMEFIDGQTVDSYMAAKGRLDPEEALKIALQVTRALGAAAKQQLVHRDLKPANLMLVDEDGEKIVKVIDFGLAKSIRREGEDSGTLTMAGGFVGTPHFASPEQLEERDIDIRSDFYSLGATLYYMLTGRPPFAGSVAQIMSQHLYKPIPLEPLEGVPECVKALLHRMMEKDRDKRPQNAAELRQEIIDCLEKLRGATTAVAPTAVGPGETHDTLATLEFKPPPPAELSPGVRLADRYELIRLIGEVQTGQKFVANDHKTGTTVALLVFSKEFLADRQRLASLEAGLDQARARPEKGLVQPLSVESVSGHTFLVEEYVAGPSLSDLLRARGALSGAEAAQIAVLLAPVVDAAQAQDLPPIDLTLMGVQLNCRGWGAADYISEVLHASLFAWPSFETKTNLDLISTRLDAATWAGSATMVGSAVAGGGDQGSYLRRFGLLLYELLGGSRSVAETTGRLSPLAALPESGNLLLRKAITDDLPTAGDFAEQLQGAIAGREPVSVVPLVRPGVHSVVAPPSLETAPPVPPPIAPLPPAVKPPSSGSVVRPPSSFGTNIPPLVPAGSAAGTSAGQVTSVPVPEPGPSASIIGLILVGLVSCLLVVLLGLAFFFVSALLSRPNYQISVLTSPTPSASPTAEVETTPTPEATAIASATPTPVATPFATPTPKPTAVVEITPKPTPVVETTPTPVVETTPKPTPVVETTPTPVATPSRAELLAQELDKAQSSARSGEWHAALRSYLNAANEFPESNEPKARMENLLSEVRRSKTKVTAANFSDIRSDLESAANQSVVQAMLILAEFTQTSEASTSLQWYEKAADLGNVQAKVQAGLMLANHRNTTDDRKAVEYFSGAAESGDAMAKYLLAECYYYGKGVVPDQKKAVAILEEAAALQEPRAMDLLGTHYRQLHDYEKARKYYESAAALGYARSSTNLGVMYMNGEGIASNSATAAKLFLTAAENGDAIGMFNYAYCLQTGKGVTADTQAANEWAKKSAKAGFAKAIEWCRERNISYQ